MKEYTTAKILGNVLIFLVPWLTLVIASFVVITSRSSLPDGLVSYALLILTELFVNYCLLLAIALMTESQGWTTVGIVTGNLAFNAFLYYVSNLSAIRTVMLGSSIAWNSTFSTVLLLEVAVVIALLGFTFFVQFRKTDFV